MSVLTTYLHAYTAKIYMYVVCLVCIAWFVEVRFMGFFLASGLYCVHVFPCTGNEVGFFLFLSSNSCLASVLCFPMYAVMGWVSFFKFLFG